MTQTCPSCNSRVDVADQFCGECGRRLHAPTNATSEPATEDSKSTHTAVHRDAPPPSPVNAGNNQFFKSPVFIVAGIAGLAMLLGIVLGNAPQQPTAISTPTTSADPVHDSVSGITSGLGYVRRGPAGSTVCDSQVLNCVPAQNAVIGVRATVRSEQPAIIVLGKGAYTSEHEFKGFLNDFGHNPRLSDPEKPFIYFTMLDGSITGDAHQNVVQIIFGGGNCIIVNGSYAAVVDFENNVSAFRLHRGEAHCRDAKGQNTSLEGENKSLSWYPKRR